MTAQQASPGVSALQSVSSSVAATAAAAALAQDVLVGSSTVTEQIERVARYLSALPRVETVAAALIGFAPDDADGWMQLGQRAWLREWAGSPSSTCKILPDADAGPEAALTMPWLSRHARWDVIALPDVEALPPEADQDRRELLGCGARSIVASTQVSNGVMFGSISVGSATTGDWPEEYVADLRLLSAALSSRMSAEHAQRSLADAIAVGDQARASQQQFFSTIGHELRTPLAAVIGYAEMMAEDAAAHDDGFGVSVATDSRVILRAGEQIAAIVEDLLSTGRLLGHEERRELVDVAAAVEDVVHWHRTPAASGQVTVTSSVEAGLHVRARPSGLRQVLTNLVGNAIVHNAPGGHVEIGAQPLSGEGGQSRLRITVRDDGSGLQPDEAARVFEPFVRFAGDQVRGTGLGLSLSRAVAERDGGVMGLESQPGVGSVFWVDLPAG